MARRLSFFHLAPRLTRPAASLQPRQCAALLYAAAPSSTAAASRQSKAKGKAKAEGGLWGQWARRALAVGAAGAVGAGAFAVTQDEGLQRSAQFWGKGAQERCCRWW